ncbi:MAG: AAA family ATPase [Rhodoblastus sp.]|nr:AAA family ATPase [Rhodoblastus sp.]
MSPHESPGQSPSARSRLTILFTDLVGSTMLAREMEAEDFAALLDDLREICRNVVAERGGRIARMQGDGATIVFGHPEPGEDDGRRAIDAALDIHQKVGAMRPIGLPPRFLPLRMHSGVHAGTVLIADGDIERGVFDLVGDVPNVAARLSQRAAPGEILASVDSVGPNAHFYKLGAPADLSAIGLDLPVHVVLGRSAAASRFESTVSRGLTPFIGRRELVEQLCAFLLDPHAAPRATVVRGGAGLGKTRLIEEVLRSIDPQEAVVLRGGCENYLGAEILQPFLQMVRGYIGLRDGVTPGEALALSREALEPWRGELGPRIDSVRGLVVVSPDIRPAEAATRAVDDLAAFIMAIAKSRRVALVIDDWQWADDATRQLMAALLQSASPMRVILTSRSHDDDADLVAGASQIELKPFAGAETERAVRRWLPQADPFLIARIHDYAGGVPLYIEELCHLASADKLFHALLGGGRAGWIGALVTSRLQRLPEQYAEIVRAAAVVGNVAPYRSLIAACGYAPTDDALRALAEADFLFVDAASGGLRFKHGITRDSVYESIGLKTRRMLHRRIAEAHLARGQGLDHDDTLEALAYHSFGAGDWEKAARFAEQAGDKATLAFALDRARAHYKAALDAMDHQAGRGPDHDGRWCLLVNKLGMASIFDPLSLRNDVSLFERAAELARVSGDVDAEARANYWLGYMCYGFGRFREGVVHARRAAGLARRAGDPRLVAQVEATLGQILAAAGRYDEALQLIDAAVVTKRRAARPGGGIAIGSAYALSCEASILADRGDFAAADARFDEATALLGGTNHPVANSMRNWRVVSLAWRGAWAQAETLASENARVAENMRGLLLLATSRAAAGYARWRRTGETDALQQLRDAIRWMEGRNFKFFVSVQYSWLVEACAEVGDIDGARRYAAHVLLRARHSERLGEAAVSRVLAQIAAKGDRPDDCARWMRRAELSARLRGSRREAALNEAQCAILETPALDAECRHRHAERAQAELRAMGMDWYADRLRVLI